MRSNLCAISGLAGAGKDTVADYLIRNHGCVKIALADPIKRICKEIYGFTDEQLWGPSSRRNAPDLRYPRKHFEAHNWKFVDTDASYSNKYTCVNCTGIQFTTRYEGPRQDTPCTEYLTPRLALQLCGTEFGRACFENTWVHKACDIAKQILDKGYDYQGPVGLIRTPRAEPYRSVLITDVRFVNEMAAFWNAGGEVWRVRPGKPGDPMPAPLFDHPSETEQLTIPDAQFDRVIYNQKTAFEDLYKTIEEAVR